MSNNKIKPCIWFHTEGGKLSEVISYYKTAFDNNFHAGSLVSLGQTPSGYTEICEVEIFGHSYSFMATAIEHHSLNDAISLMINCEHQAEIDRFWNYFTSEGKAAPCGWCIDKYGIRWQVLPKNLAQLMSKPNAFEIMMKQTKIIIEEFYNH